jgi:hypothetical protein
MASVHVLMNYRLLDEVLVYFSGFAVMFDLLKPFVTEVASSLSTHQNFNPNLSLSHIFLTFYVVSRSQKSS